MHGCSWKIESTMAVFHKAYPAINTYFLGGWDHTTPPPPPKSEKNTNPNQCTTNFGKCLNVTMPLDCLNPPNMGNFMTLLYRPCGPTQRKSPPGLHAILETPQRLAERSGRFLYVHILLLDGGEIKYCYISTSLGWDIGKPHWKKTIDKLPTSTG